MEDEEQALPPVMVVGDHVRQRLGDLVHEVLVERGQSWHCWSCHSGSRSRESRSSACSGVAVGHRDEHLVAPIGAPHQRRGDDGHDQPAEGVAAVVLPHGVLRYPDAMALQATDVALDEGPLVLSPLVGLQARPQQVAEVGDARSEPDRLPVDDDHPLAADEEVVGPEVAVDDRPRLRTTAQVGVEVRGEPFEDGQRVRRDATGVVLDERRHGVRDETDEVVEVLRLRAVQPGEVGQGLVAPTWSVQEGELVDGAGDLVEREPVHLVALLGGRDVFQQDDVGVGLDIVRSVVAPRRPHREVGGEIPVEARLDLVGPRRAAPRSGCPPRQLGPWRSASPARRPAGHSRGTAARCRRPVRSRPARPGDP